MNNRIALELEIELGKDEIGQASLRMVTHTLISASGEMVFKPGTPEGRAALQRLVDTHLVIPTGRIGADSHAEIFRTDPRIKHLQED